jgi:hypothetical protein
VNAGIFFKNIDQGYAGAIDFSTRALVGNYGIRMRIDQLGNVLIGTTTNPNTCPPPSGPCKLYVNGPVAGTNIAAQYQDLAEWVPSGRRLEATTVVVLDPDRPVGVAPSTLAYDTRVAGVVSANPGVILGQAATDRSMIATTGRVKVKADATHGPILVGDLLVTSDREGYAMRSEPIDVAGVKIHRPGTIVGKALEPLRNGPGEISVLLTLQ